MSAEKPSAPPEPAPSPAPAPTRSVTRRGGADLTSPPAPRRAPRTPTSPPPTPRTSPRAPPALRTTFRRSPTPSISTPRLDAAVGPEEDEARARPAIAGAPNPRRGAPFPPRRRVAIRHIPGRGRVRRARAFVPAPGETTPDPFGATPSKRRRVTFAEVDACSLGEDDDRRRARRSRDGAIPSLLGGRDGGGRDGTRARTRAFLPPPTRSASSAVRFRRRRARTPAPESRVVQTGALDDDGAIALAIARCSFAAHRVDRGSFPLALSRRGCRGGDGRREPLTPSRWIRRRDVRHGDALADVDEAQYALGGLAPEQPAGGRLASAATLVALVADPRRRRALAAHGLAPRVLRAALDLGRSVVDGDARRRGDRGGVGSRPRDDATRRRRVVVPLRRGSPGREGGQGVRRWPTRHRTRGSVDPERTRPRTTPARRSRVRRRIRRRSRAAPTRERRKPFARRSGFKFLPEEELNARTLALLAAHARWRRGEGCGGGDGEGRRASRRAGAAATERIGTRTGVPIVTRTRVPTKTRRVPMRRRFGSGASSRRLWRSEA